MLQQTQVKTVIPYWERWMREFPAIPSLARAKPERVLKLWEGLGYYSRARNLQKAAQQIVAEHKGAFPIEFEKILDLPGIGRYTAGAIASIAFGQPAPIVDGNVARVLSRFLGLRGDTRNALWTAAESLVKAAENPGDLNQGLMELGATLCLPRNPLCDSCPIQSQCYAWKNGKTDELPEPVQKPALTPKLFRAAVVLDGGKILLRQRPAGMVNAGFWELPNIETDSPAPDESFRSLFNRSDLKISPLCQIKHTITRYRMTLEVFRVSNQNLDDGKWFKIHDLQRLPLVSSHRKALQKARIVDLLNARAAKNLMEPAATSATL